LGSWQKSWPNTKAPIAKVIFDPAKAEVRVLVRLGNNEIQKVFSVDQDLSAALRQAEAFIKEQARR
jgi:glutamine synthetase type III